MLHLSVHLLENVMQIVLLFSLPIFFYDMLNIKLVVNGPELSILYSVSPSPGSDIARLFAKSKSGAPSDIAHTGSRAHKNKVCMHAITSCACVLTSLPGDGEAEYSRIFFYDMMNLYSWVKISCKTSQAGFGGSGHILFVMWIYKCLFSWVYRLLNVHHPDINLCHVF